MNFNEEKETSTIIKKTFSMLQIMGEGIKKIAGKAEKIPGKAPEIFVACFYGIAHLVMAMFHEPWYDEAVAWQIARCASYKKILFEIPHYEGHPPLWHLILSPFAKLGMSYELSLALVSLVFTGIAVVLILWYSPFPRLVKWLLPFNYFFFYQYGVISRPYCVMMLAFVLLAIMYEKRNEKPGRYVACLLLLCLTSAYGIVIAGGIAAVWVFEIWDRRKIGEFFKSFFSDKRIWWLAGLLLCAISLILMIVPREDTFAMNPLSEYKPRNNFVVRLLYMVFALPADTVLTNTFSAALDGSLKDVALSGGELAMACVLGIMILCVVIYYGIKKRTCVLFLLPYLMYCFFAATVYAWRHHTGIATLYIVFWLWVSIKNRADNKIIQGNHITKEEQQVLGNLVMLFCAVCVLVPVEWSVSSSVYEILYTYDLGRNEAAFIKEYNLDDYKIMIPWDVEMGDGDEDGTEELLGMDTGYFAWADNLSPYFDENIFYNYRLSEQFTNYTTHKRSTEEENERNIQSWKEAGMPDVLFLDPKLELVFEEQEINEVHYALVYSEKVGRIWKGDYKEARVHIYVRSELLEEVGLERIVEPYMNEED